VRRLAAVKGGWGRSASVGILRFSGANAVALRLLIILHSSLSNPRGTLGDAVKRAGLFHRRLSNGTVGIDLPAVIDVGNPLILVAVCLLETPACSTALTVAALLPDTSLHYCPTHAHYTSRLTQHTNFTLHTQHAQPRSWSTWPTAWTTSTASPCSTAT
jgi:hypothetical protein